MRLGNTKRHVIMLQLPQAVPLYASVDVCPVCCNTLSYAVRHQAPTPVRVSTKVNEEHCCGECAPTMAVAQSLPSRSVTRRVGLSALVAATTITCTTHTRVHTRECT